MTTKYSENNSAYCECEETLKEKLEELSGKNRHDNPLKAHVCDYIADMYSDNEEIIGFFKDLAYGGCQSGMVCGLIYYADTYAFFDEYYPDIETLRTEMEESTGEPLALKGDLKNTLAWFGFEETAHQLSNELDLEI